MLNQSTQVLTRDGRGEVGKRYALRLLNRASQGLVAVYQQAERLVFESGPYRAHAVSFPPDWHELSDEELVAIGRTLSPAIDPATALNRPRSSGGRSGGAPDSGQRRRIEQFAKLAGVTQVIERVRAFRSRAQD